MTLSPVVPLRLHMTIRPTKRMTAPHRDDEGDGRSVGQRKRPGRGIREQGRRWSRRPLCDDEGGHGL